MGRLVKRKMTHNSDRDGKPPDSPLIFSARRPQGHMLDVVPTWAYMVWYGR